MTGTQKILVVDDSIFICRQIENILKDEKIAIYQAHSAEEALTQLETLETDLILLDIVLPDMEGYEVMRRIQKMDRNQTPIIFITSKDSEDDVIRGFNMGACDYIKKPFSSEELKSRVKAHLKEKRSRDELRYLNEALQANMEKLNRVAFRDELTGLYNRHFVVEKLAQDLEDPDRQDALVIIDVDNFKHVNDTYGHGTGDMVLVCISNIMESVCRRHKVIRWGGEEFLVILMDVTKEEALRLCESMRKEIEEFPFAFHGITFFCTVTLGLALYDKDKEFEANVECADKALYEGKATGKNRTILYRIAPGTGA